MRAASTLVLVAALAGCGGGDSGAANQPPLATILSPAAGSRPIVGQALAVTVEASDADGSIARVAFFDGSTLLGEVGSAPFTLAWTPTSAGSHSLTARATDNAGAVTTSPAVVVDVVPSGAPDVAPPTIALDEPAGFAIGLSGVITVGAQAGDDVGVTSVEFQIDGVPLGAPLAVAPYRVSLDTTAHASGQHVLRARARDAVGNWSTWAQVTVQFGGSRAQPAGIARDETWVTGLPSATAIAQTPDGRLWVAQQGGALRVIRNGVLLATPFVSLNVDAAGERGLLGVAPHPDFARNGWVYVYYTTTEGGTHNRISRFTASAANPDVAQPGSEQKLVDLPALSAATNHNGGALHFGADGKLYVGVGDNANPAAAPDLRSPFGKLLRFNDDGSIPGDNPHFGTQVGLARAIWARGLRNPFTFAVQPGTGRIHVNDVGQNTWEEVNLGAPGADFGWPAVEGPDLGGAGRNGPLFAYRHGAASPAGSGPGGFFVGIAIAGGAFYPAAGSLPAPWRGNYFFADYGTGFIGLLDLANDNAAYAFGAVSGNPVDLLAASDGSLLVLTRSGIVRFHAP